MPKIFIDHWEDDEIIKGSDELTKEIQENNFIRIYIMLLNFIKQNYRVLNKISVINNRYEKFRSAIRRDYFIECIKLRLFLNTIVDDDIQFHEEYVMMFIKFLDFIKLFGYKNDSSCLAWSEIAPNGYELYLKIYDNRILHFSEYDLEVTPLLKRSENSIISIIEDKEPESIHSIKFEETDDILEKPIISLNCRRVGNKIVDLLEENFMNDKAASALLSKFSINIISIYKKILEDILGYMCIDKLLIHELLEDENGARIFIPRSEWKRYNN